MNLNISEWKPFIIEKIFTVKYGVNLELSNCDEIINNEEIGIKFVSRTESNNGVSATVKSIEEVTPQKEGLITVAGGGSVLSTFIQPEPFYSGRDLYTLEAKDTISFEAKMFIITIIKANKYKYSYGRQANKTLPYIELMLPVQRDKNNNPIIDATHKYSDEGFVPDWQFMEDFIKSLHHKPLTTKNKPETTLKFDATKWKEFRVGDIFDIHPTKSIDDISSDDCCGYGTPLVVNQSYNNGVTGFCDNSPTERGGIITFSDTWEGETFFYQPYDFIGFAHVQGMYPRDIKLSPECMIFLCTVLEFDARGRYSYGRKKRRDIISEVKLKLPIKHKTDGTPYIDDTHKFSDKGYVPDWQFMEDYIKSLPYGDRI